jgi:hypothetical protein
MSAFSLFGLTPEVVQLQLKRGLAGLEGLKNMVHQRWKVLAFDTHPDRGGDSNQFRQLDQARRLIMSLQFGRQISRAYTTVARSSGNMVDLFI